MARFHVTYRFLLLFALIWTSGVARAGSSDSSFLAGFDTYDTDEIRVMIMDHLNLEGVAITPRVSGLNLIANGKSYRLGADQRVRFERDGGNVVARFDRERVKAAHIRLEFRTEGAFDVDSGSLPYMRTYTGSLDVHVKSGKKGLSIVNRVPIEDYVASVVGAEYGLNDVEGAKAMAVVARTYALHAAERNSRLLDSERSQVYKGLQKANAAARSAAAATAGQVLTFRGDLIEAVYSSSNGGRTASNASVWGTNVLPYLKSRKDPFDAQKSPHASWTWEMDEGKMKKALSNAFGRSVKEIRVTETARDGRVLSVELKGRDGKREISGSAFRAALARAFGAMTVKSTYFKLNEKRNRYVFEGHGFGHGVGLSQWGAHAMALDGRSYDEILDFYYDGTRLESIPQGTSVMTEVTLAGLQSAGPTSNRRTQDASRTRADSNAHNMSISRSSGEESSASLDAVSNGSGTPKAEISTFSQERESTDSSTQNTAQNRISADSVWGQSKVDSDEREERRESSRKSKKKKQRRSGW